LDVRYIPDDLSFNDRKVHDEATEVPTDYTAPDFLTRVLGATNVDSTWEQNDPKRTRLVKNFFTKEKIRDSDFKDLIASDSDEEHTKEDKYKSLLDDIKVQPQNDFEVKFVTDLNAISNDRKEHEIISEAQNRESRRLEKMASAINRRSDDEVNDDFFNEIRGVNTRKTLEDFDTQDKIWKDFDKGFEEDTNRVQKKSRRSWTKEDNTKDTEELTKEQKKSREELELLVAEDEHPKNKPSIPFLLEDDRFSALVDDPRFSRDPTDPRYKPALATNDLIHKAKEVLKAKGVTVREPNPLASLVLSVKNKTRRNYKKPEGETK